MKGSSQVLRILFVLIVGLALSGTALAAPPGPVPRPNVGRRPPLILPEQAQVAPGVYYLGAVEHEGRIVEGYALVRYQGGAAKPGTQCGNGVCEPGENANKCPQDCGGTKPDDSSCYAFLARGAKWKTAEPYIVDPTNERDLSEAAVRGAIATSIAKWEDAADGAMGNGNSLNILGDESTGTVDGADTVSPDNKNEVLFGDIQDSGAIAVTIVWGVFGGLPFARELVEWDQVYDDVDYDWSENCESDDCTAKMDLENIVIHELGHSVGLADLYTAECAEQTMYGYADYGETKKRTLEAGDIAGVSTLYR
ncbi:MAG: matrixin family metalloprotease [Chloroflexi bacterium]|nr:matrixin family metalloprotease [Chloroflexota bacterium]